MTMGEGDGQSTDKPPRPFSETFDEALEKLQPADMTAGIWSEESHIVLQDQPSIISLGALDTNE